MAEYSVPEVSAVIQNKESVQCKEHPSIADFQKLAPQEQGGKYYYGVQIITGKHADAGTRADVYVTLVGDKGKTGKLSLRGFFEFSPVARNTCENLMVVTEEDLGKVLVVIVGCDDSWIEDQWYVCVVTVGNLQSFELERFPCYHWIGEMNHVSFTAHTTKRKDVADNSILLGQRASQLRQRQSMYKWRMFSDSGLPSGIDESGGLPPDEQWGMATKVNFMTDGLSALGLLKLAGITRNPDNLHFYEVMADRLGEKECILYQAGRWTSDVEFGRQMLNGVNPVIIKKCEKLPPNFPVTNEMVQPFLELPLEQEMKAGHIYICDMKAMDGIKARENYFSVAPICLLYVNKGKQLVPIAIQLKQGVREDEKENNPIFLPSDNWIEWLLAKTYYQSAHSQVHQGLTHYTSCHATMEAFTIGTHRNLPDAHPVFKLLKPHLRYTIGINIQARKTLINKGGKIDDFFGAGGEGMVELWKRCGAAYDVRKNSIKYYAKERGVDNPDQLPGYYYRDDGFKVWDALEQYVRSIINEFYKSDQDITEDEELQAWAHDIHTNGLSNHGNPEVEPGHGFPDKIVSREELISYCTLIAFTGSGQHASVNFLQSFFYRFVPNAPFGVRCPPPPKKGEIDFQYYLQSLPDEDTAINSIATTHLLSQYSDNEILLGDYKERFTETTAKEAIEKFQGALKDISELIKKRNEGLELEYTGFLPEKIPNSITI